MFCDRVTRDRTLAAMGLLAAGVMLAGCGSSDTPTVASVQQGAASPQGSASPKGATGAQSDDQQVTAYVEAANRFSACMRAKGFASSNVTVQDVLSEPKPDTPAQAKQSYEMMTKPGWDDAFEECSPLQLPAPAAVEKAQSPKLTDAQVKTLKSYSVCMRAHNVPEYPDPSPDQIKTGVPAGSAAEAIQDTPRYLAALKTCDSSVLGIKAGSANG